MEVLILERSKVIQSENSMLRLDKERIIREIQVKYYFCCPIYVILGFSDQGSFSTILFNIVCNGVPDEKVYCKVSRNRIPKYKKKYFGYKFKIYEIKKYQKN